MERDSGITAGSFGVVGAIFALQFFAEVPKVRKDILQVGFFCPCLSSARSRKRGIGEEKSRNRELNRGKREGWRNMGNHERGWEPALKREHKEGEDNSADFLWSSRNCRSLETIL